LPEVITEPMVQHARASRRNFYWIIAAVAAFLGYAFNFLYFFVDDEGIPLVYAQNLLRGRGLIYTTLEGRVESYTDFLHVLLDALSLGAVRLVHAPKLSVFFVGKALALTAGAGCVVVAFLTMRRMKAFTDPGAMSGLAVLALSGPFAVWSCSSMETAPFALLLSLLTYALVAASESLEARRLDRLTAVAAVLVALERLDGLLYSAVLVGAFWILADSDRRIALWKRVVLPAGTVLAIYHGWRIWYFGNLLNLPLYAKVLYKLMPQHHLLVKAPPIPYGLRFVQIYGWPAVVVVVAAVGVATLRSRPIRPLVLAAAALVAYVSLVGDWMFGLRFFAHLMPLVAVIIAMTVSTLFIDRRMLAWAATLSIVVWSGISAGAFEREYESATGSASWLREPSFDASRFFSTYYGLLDVARTRVGYGERIAYNQAGFLPFMLGLENIDNLGICSRFYAHLPVRDLFFTEVGHYAPLTARVSIGAEEAYLLYQDVPFIIQRGDLLRAANDGRTPAELMGGYYRLLARDPLDYDVLYARTERDASEYKKDPRLFFENLAHPAYVETVAVNHQPVVADDVATALPFLRESTGSVIAEPAYNLDIRFARDDVEVSELDINQIQAVHQPVTVSLELLSATGVSRDRTTLPLASGEMRGYVRRLPAPVQAARLVMRIDSTTQGKTRVSINDLRVQGQTPELARYIRAALRF
jgi:hypothetical protein